MSPGSLADLVLTVHQGRMYDRYRENAGPLWLHAPIGLDICASVGLRHTRGRPPRGPRPAFVLRRNLTAASPRDGVGAASMSAADDRFCPQHLAGPGDWNGERMSRNYCSVRRV